MRTFSYVVIALLPLFSINTMAYPKHDPNVYDNGNLWSITFHDDDSVSHNQWATQRICFLPYSTPSTGRTQLKGRWYSTTYPNWNGHYRQEGDSVKMVGNFWQGRGNDGITFDIVSSNPHTGLGVKHGTIGAGHWSEWGDSGSAGRVYGFGNALLERVGKCRVFRSIDAGSLGIRKRLLENGKIAEYPLQSGQVSLEKTYNHLEELFAK